MFIKWGIKYCCVEINLFNKQDDFTSVKKNDNLYAELILGISNSHNKTFEYYITNVCFYIFAIYFKSGSS